MVTEIFDFDFSLTFKKLPRSPRSPRSDCPKNRVCVSSVGAIESLDDFELIDVWYMSRGQKLLEPHTIKVAVTPVNAVRVLYVEPYRRYGVNQTNCGP